MKEQIINLQKEIDHLKLESKEKDDAILELSQFYYVSYFIIIIFYLQYYQKQNSSEPLNEDNNDGEKII